MRLDKLYELVALLKSGDVDTACDMAEREIRVELVKAKTPKFNIFDFCAGKDEIREPLKGVYYDPEGFAVATDARALIVLVDETRSGQIIGRDGQLIEGTYPQWRAVIPRRYEESRGIDPGWVRQIVETRKEMRVTKNHNRHVVRVWDKCIDADLFSRFLTGCAAIGADSVMFNSNGPLCPLLAQTPRGIVLVMPLDAGHTDSSSWRFEQLT